MPRHPTALIADDEPLLRDSLARQLAAAWPELEVVAQARNGREALKLFEEKRPDVCFLDVHMPGPSGVEVARQIGRRAHLVFVTAYDQYAVQAFAQGALDYLVKPVEPERLAETVARLRERLAAAQPAADTEAVLRQLAAQLAALAGGHGVAVPPAAAGAGAGTGAGAASATAAGAGAAPAPGGSLRWIRAQVGPTVRLIAVEDIDYLRSDSKYTLVAWRGEGGRPGEALVRMPLKDLVAQLDPERFAQVHRSVVVNLRAVSHVTRSGAETADLHLKGRDEVLPVSRSYLHLFRQM